MIRLLALGDLHLGRQSSKCNAYEVTCAGAWRRAVAWALEERPDAVLLSGDILDASNTYLESLGPLEKGCRELNEAEIPVLAVSGNHDYNTLPRFVQRGSGLALLGAGGKWESQDLVTRHGRAFRIVGWSYPSEHPGVDPLDSLSLPLADVPVIGMVHVDLDSASSPFARATVARLQTLPVDIWLTGHIHAPRWIAGQPGVLNPGSPQAMDPGETGPHGAWCMEIPEVGPATASPIPLSSVRYEGLRLGPLAGTTLADWEDQAASEIRRLETSMVMGTVECLSLRLEVVTERAMSGGDAERLRAAIQSLTAPGLFIDQVRFVVAPRLEIGELAARPDTAGDVARLIQRLDRGESDPLVKRCVELLTGHRARVLGPASASDTADADYEARARLRAQAITLLEALVREP